MSTPSQTRIFLIALAIGVLFGVPIGCGGFHLLQGILIMLAMAGSVSIFCLQMLRIANKKLIAIAMCCGLCIGYGRALVVMHTRNEYKTYFDGHSELLADVVSAPQEKNGFLEVVMRGVNLHQKIAVRMPLAADPQFGQRVVLSGTLHAPQPIDTFDYPDYLRSKGVTATEAMPHAFAVAEIDRTPLSFLQSLGYILQKKLSAQMLARYEPTIQPFLKALMFGDRGDFSADESEQFVRTGTIHLIAVSGFKLTILLLMMQYILQPFIPRKWLIVMVLAVSGLYATVFSFDPPVLRAAVISLVCIIGELVGGGYQATAMLVLLAGIFALLNPAAESFDSSMLFSVLGVLGITIIGPMIRNIGERISHTSFPLKFLAPAAGAYLLTMPLSFYWYGEVSLLMPFTALCIMPFFEPCIVLGYSSAAPFFGSIAAAINQPLLKYLTWSIEHLSALRFAIIPMHISGYVAYVVYTIACAMYSYTALKKAQRSATIPALPTKPVL